MFREKINNMEIHITHHLSNRGNTKKESWNNCIEPDLYISSKIEIRQERVRGGLNHE